MPPNINSLVTYTTVACGQPILYFSFCGHIFPKHKCLSDIGYTGHALHSHQHWHMLTAITVSTLFASAGSAALPLFGDMMAFLYLPLTVTSTSASGMCGGDSDVGLCNSSQNVLHISSDDPLLLQVGFRSCHSLSC